MKKLGILIYQEEDIAKNQWFIDNLIAGFEHEDIVLKLITVNDFLDKSFSLENISFVINRSRNNFVAMKLTKNNENIFIFNDPIINVLANDKFATYFYFKKLGLAPLFTTKNPAEIAHFPCVMKSINGHGGNEVHLVNSFDEIETIKSHENRDYIFQELSEETGKDIRVFILDNKIIGMVLRYNDNDFRANYSLGGKIELIKDYPEDIIRQVNLILSRMDAKFIGIDFLKSGNRYIPNEIEDPVGFRSLFSLKKVDVISMIVDLVKSQN